MQSSVAASYLNSTSRTPDGAFLRSCQQGNWTRASYAQAVERVAHTARWLQSYNLKRYDRLAWYANEDVTEELLYISLACACLGIVVCPLGAHFSVPAFEHLVKNVEATAILTTPALTAALEHMPLQRLVIGGAGPTVPSPDALPWLEEHAREVLPADAYGIFQVSTNTGESTYVIRSHRSFVGQTPHFAEGLQTNGDQPRVLLLNSLNHSAGHTSVSLALEISGEMGLPSKIDRHAPPLEVREFAPHIAITSDRVISTILDQIGDAPLFGPGPTKAVIVGPNIDPALLSRLIAAGIDAGECYGTQETGLLVTTPPGGWRPGYKGRVLPDIELRCDEDGEVLVRSPRAMSGYLGNIAEELTRAAFNADGFYRSGDYGVLEDDGYLRILGRKKDVLRIHDGSLVYPTRIEDMIWGATWIDRVTLLGDQRPYLMAFIELGVKGLKPEPDGYLDPATHPERYVAATRLLRHVNRRLEAIERVRRVVLFQAVPRPLDGPRQNRSARERSRAWAMHKARFEGSYLLPTDESEPTWVAEPHY